MKNEKLKKVLESPITRSLIVGSASAGAFSAGCMAIDIFKNIPILGKVFDAVVVPASVAVGALAYLELADIEFEVEVEKEPETESNVVQEPFEI